MPKSNALSQGKGHTVLDAGGVKKKNWEGLNKSSTKPGSKTHGNGRLCQALMNWILAGGAILKKKRGFERKGSKLCDFKQNKGGGKCFHHPSRHGTGSVGVHKMSS